jgi:uncharacterized protein involved in exopolysaccharide biosynthesis
MADDTVLDLRRSFLGVKKHLTLILCTSFAAGVVTMLYLLTVPNQYKASAVLTPVSGDNKMQASIGALASVGLSVGGPTKVEELIGLFRSKDLTVRVFRKYNLLPLVIPNAVDKATGKRIPKWHERLFRLGGEKEIQDDWDFIRVSEGQLSVGGNVKAGTLTISFESPSPRLSADIVRYYLEEAKSRLQEEAFDRATKNKKFIEGNVASTVDALSRDRLYTLYGQEVEREMLARNREQFGFRIIDAPRAPDLKSRPRRAITSAGVFTITFLLLCTFFLLRGAEGDKSRGVDNSEGGSLQEGRIR